MAEATLIRHSRIYGVLALFAVLIGACAVWLRIDVERQHVAAKTARASMVAAARELVVALYEQNGVRDESELTEAWLTNIAAERLASGQWRVQIARDWQETMRSDEACDSDAPFLMITRVGDEGNRDVVAVSCMGIAVDGEDADADGFDVFVFVND